MRLPDQVTRACSGTSLAPALHVPAPVFAAPSADAVWRSQRDRFFLSEARKTARITLGLGVLVQLLLLAIMCHAGYPTWRIGALGGLYVAFAIAHKFIICLLYTSPSPRD